MKPENEEVLTQGLIAGLVGYLVVVVFFFIVNLIAGQSPFYTAALLGGAVFYGVSDPSAIEVAAGPVIAYNGLHMILFIVLGFITAWLARLSERGPEFWYIAILVFMFVAFHMYGALLLLTEPFRDVFPIWQSFVSGALASAGMAAFLWWARPGLRRELREYREE